MLTVLMPSRGRERQATEAYEAFCDTKALDTTQMLIVLTVGEPGYANLPVIYVAEGGGMGAPLNAALSCTGQADIVGFMGDDHRTLTPAWDETIVTANETLGGGIIYGNDLLRGADLPSQVFIDARIIRALGWMALPGARHLYLDDTWRELGKRMGRLKYLADVHIEHLHFTAGKAEMDDGYARVNAPEMYEHDRAIYSAWMRDRLDIDAATALAALD